MREIKFRAWGRYGEWEEDGENQKYKMLYDDTLAFEEYAPINELLGSVEHLMQYTGLKDKNGKEIYEGDIANFVEHTHPRRGKITWQVEHGCWSIEFRFGGLEPMPIMMMSAGLSDYEVIGNIHENPELLTEP